MFLVGFFHEVYICFGRNSKGEFCPAVPIRNGKIAFVYNVHTNKHISFATRQLTFANWNAGHHDFIWKPNVDEKSVCLDYVLNI